jgi:hypothetical protein
MFVALASSLETDKKQPAGAGCFGFVWFEVQVGQITALACSIFSFQKLPDLMDITHQLFTSN